MSSLSALTSNFASLQVRIWGKGTNGSEGLNERKTHIRWQAEPSGTEQHRREAPLDPNATGNGSTVSRPNEPPPAHKPPLVPEQRKDTHPRTDHVEIPPAKRKKSFTSKIKSTFSGLTGLRIKKKDSHIAGATAYSNRSGRDQASAPATVSREAARQGASTDVRTVSEPVGVERSSTNVGAAASRSDAALGAKAVRMEFREVS